MHLLHNFYKQTSFLLGPIQPSSPTTKELHALPLKEIPFNDSSKYDKLKGLATVANLIKPFGRNYDSRVVLTSKLLIFTTLDSEIAIIEAL